MYATLVVVTQFRDLGADNLPRSCNILNTKNERDSYGMIRGTIPNPERATHMGPITRYYLTTTGEGKKLDAVLLERYRKAAAVEEMRGIKHEDNTMIESFASIWLQHYVGNHINEKRYVGTLHRTYVPKCVNVYFEFFIKKLKGAKESKK